MNDPQQAIKVLETALSRSPSAIQALLCNRVPCTVELADDPDVVVEVVPVLDGPHFTVGALGLVNGVLTALGYDRVAARFSDPGPGGQRKLLGFVRYPVEREETRTNDNSE